MLTNIEDGPSTTLLSIIKNNNMKAPQDWKGFRELTSKWYYNNKFMNRFKNNNLFKFYMTENNARKRKDYD